MEEQEQKSLYKRVEELEDWKQNLLISWAVQSKDLEYMDKRFDKIDKQFVHMEKKMEEANVWVKRAVSIVAILVLTAIVKFVLDGGLSNV